uniref:AAA+ ATPase domain-containing protein n=1 Tax=Oryza brachyantha TaxID=4533 RepID=J3MLD0_ORYBR
MDLSAAAAASPSLAKAVDTYRKAVATAATMTAYAVLARGMVRELVPYDLREAVSWAASLVRARLKPLPAERRTVIINRLSNDFQNLDDNCFYVDAHVYLASRIDPRWTSVPGDGNETEASLELSFDVEHTDMAMCRNVPFIREEVEKARRQDRELKIYMNEGFSWRGIVHCHSATFGTLAMDPDLKKSILDDLDRFLKRKEYYRRIGKAWKRGYLLYGPPGTGKSSLVAAMANYLRFDLYDLDLSEVRGNYSLQKLLVRMPNKSILVVEDIDCCFDAKPREDCKAAALEQAAASGNTSGSDDDSDAPPPCRPGGELQQQKITLSGLLNFIDGLWSTSGEERVIVFTTNYRDRLDPALLRPGRMDMHVYMGYCGWDAFKTLVHNYFVIADHPMFPEIQGLLGAVEVTPAEVSEMLLRSEDVDAALVGLAEFLEDKKKKAIA